MANKISIQTPCKDIKAPRIGGGALIGNVCAWPCTPGGVPLTLVLSLPTDFVNNHIGSRLPGGKFVSVFSYYSKDDYFLDYICYHGNPEELKLLKTGYTKTLIHDDGAETFAGALIPPMRIDVTSASEDLDTYQGSKIGGNAGLLQNEPISLDGLDFALQLYGGDFPEPFRDIFFLSDAVGYLYVPSLPNETSGFFFAQTT